MSIPLGRIDHEPPPAPINMLDHAPSAPAATPPGIAGPTVRPDYLAVEWDPARRQVHLHTVYDVAVPNTDAPAPLVTLRKRTAIELRDELNAIFPPAPKAVPPGPVADDRLIGIIENLTKAAR